MKADVLKKSSILRNTNIVRDYGTPKSISYQLKKNSKSQKLKEKLKAILIHHTLSYG